MSNEIKRIQSDIIFYKQDGRVNDGLVNRLKRELKMAKRIGQKNKR